MNYLKLLVLVKYKEISFSFSPFQTLDRTHIGDKWLKSARNTVCPARDWRFVDIDAKNNFLVFSAIIENLFPFVILLGIWNYYFFHDYIECREDNPDTFFQTLARDSLWETALSSFIYDRGGMTKSWKVGVRR